MNIELWKEKTKGLFNIVEWTRFWNIYKNKEDEIERLEQDIHQLKYESDKEIERLNNIINELEKWITFSDTESFNPAINYDDECKMEYIYVDDILDKLKELKEGK